jgi:hypothetical protein
LYQVVNFATGNRTKAQLVAHIQIVVALLALAGEPEAVATIGYMLIVQQSDRHCQTQLNVTTRTNLKKLQA